MASQFDYLVRFIDETGQTVYGNLPKLSLTESLIGCQAQLLHGDPIVGLKATGQNRTILKVLCPLNFTPIFQCIGINYAKHAKEANTQIPSQPVVFTKPADAIAGPFDDIYCHPDARPQLDYEGELAFIFATDCKDATEETALDYILGYTVANDVSARNYIPQEVSGFQMSYGKSFDGWAPFGPVIASPAAVGDPHSLQLTTKVNGEVRQNESTGDMIWNLKQIIVHLTRGRTVRAGTVCLTGTPSGVGWWHPGGYLRAGDVVEVTIEKVGTIRNKIVFW